MAEDFETRKVPAPGEECTLSGLGSEVVLLALAGIGRETTGREVYEAIVDTTGRDASVASVHITLNRLHEKAWATGRVEPPPGAGGKPRWLLFLSAALASSTGQPAEQVPREPGVLRTRPPWVVAPELAEHPGLSEDGHAAPAVLPRGTV